MKLDSFDSLPTSMEYLGAHKELPSPEIIRSDTLDGVNYPNFEVKYDHDVNGKKIIFKKDTGK